MKRTATRCLALLAVVAATASLTAPAPAAPRVPQQPVLGGTLQAFFQGIGEGIDVNADQDATQAWTRTSSNTTSYTIQLQNSAGAPAHSLYLYNSSAGPAPPLYLLLLGDAGPLGFSTATFRPGGVLVVNRFDGDGNFLGSLTYGGVDPDGFAFALHGVQGTFFTQDARNPGGLVQALAYRGTGANTGVWFLCWEESPMQTVPDQDFDDEVIVMESVNPTPVHKASWGQVKSRFRWTAAR